MTDRHGYRPAPGAIPDSPGVYRFRDQHGRVIYVGKAKSLRQRLNSYFADFAGLHPRTQAMLNTAAGVDWTVVGTEVEAFQLEYSWIKEFDPRFNIRYRDDKSYPYLAVTMSEEYPRVMVMRGAKRKGTRYFGPYSHAWAIRDTVDTLLRVFPVRTCSAGVFKRSGQIGLPCLLGYIGKCSAPCVGRVSADDHRALAEDFCDSMAGQTSRFASRLEGERFPFSPFRIRWDALIEDFRWLEGFCDVQLRGPFRYWRHCHTVQPHRRGTLLRDEVEYELPLGPLSPLADKLFVHRQLAATFPYRHRRTLELLALEASLQSL